MNKEPLIIEQEYNAPVELLWRAITEKDLMQKWYFDISDFKLELGAKFHFEGGKDGRVYVHECEILEIIPLRKFKYSWKYLGYTGISFVTFELFPVGKLTKLKLTHEGLHSFPKENLDFIRDNFLVGWNHLIHKSLKDFLEN